MLELLQAIVTKIKGTPALMAGMNGVFIGIAPEKTPLPFVRIEVISAVPEYDTEFSYMQPVQLQFSLFAKRLEDIRGLAKVWRDAFNGQPLTLSTGALIDASLTDEKPIFEVNEGEDFSNWHYLLEFEFLQQQSSLPPA